MAPKRVKYGAYGNKVINADEYNRFNDPHLAEYLKRRKVKGPREPREVYHTREAQLAYQEQQRYL
jgi:hypothetical protein